MRLSCATFVFLAAFSGNCAVANPALPGADLFADGTLHQFEIDLPAEAVASLRAQPREPVHATVRCGADLYRDVSLHLKGSVGSFRTIDDKPAMTLDFSRLNPGQKFHGLRKIHLNNSVEDPSLLNEQLGGEIFRAAGIPAPRVSRARVVLNSRDEGLYVLIEGFTEDFLSANFHAIGAELYEPENGADIEKGMKRNSVKGVSKGDDQALETLAQAALEPDPNLRWNRLQNALDTEQFITFIALEDIMVHRDGYSIARNNYRLYHDAASGKMVFLPHGMDQLFGKADFPWEPSMAGTVAKAIMDTPQGRARYETLYPQILTRFLDVRPLTNRVNQILEQLRPALDNRAYLRLQMEAEAVNERIAARRLDLDRQLAQPRLERLEFKNGVASLRGWYPVDSPEGGRMDTVKLTNDIETLHILAGPSTMSSWRSKWLVGPGNYHFEGLAKVSGFQPLPYGTHQGAGLRITGSPRQTNGLVAGNSWSLLGADFQVAAAGASVELVLEYRASAGEAWFDLQSLKVKQIK